MSSQLPPFHVAIPVADLAQTRTFYTGLLGCDEGRSSDEWVDLNFYGHQFVLHLSPELAGARQHNAVDGHAVPIPHYGVVLPWEEWESLATRLKEAEVEFVIEPYIRFQGLPGEQATMFLLDPSGNALEFKAFKDLGQLFAT